MENGHLEWLMHWYHSQCNGYWECFNTIKIVTLGNPGWALTVNVYETEAKDKTFETIDIERTEHNWLYCKVQRGSFEARCGPFNLFEVIKVFRGWIDGEGDNMDNSHLEWLMRWYHSQCYEDWEHFNTIMMFSLGNPGWSLQVPLEYTEVENKDFKNVEIKRAQDNWLRCRVKNGRFEGVGSPYNLPDVIKVFRDWVESQG